MSVSENVTSHKSIADQIVDKMFEALDSADVFDVETIRELRQLAASNRLSRPKKVEAVIKSVSESSQ